LILESELTDKNLHDVRKRFKEIYYYLEMNHQDDYNYGGIKLNLEHIKKLEDKIGDWRDHTLFKTEMHLNGTGSKASLSQEQINAKAKMDKLLSRWFVEIERELESFRKTTPADK
jgi:CHAD domain-containing protein